MLELSGNSGIALGITTGLQFLPVLLLGLYGGVLADRYDKRRLLIGAQAAMGVLALRARRARPHRRGAAVARLRAGLRPRARRRSSTPPCGRRSCRRWSTPTTSRTPSASTARPSTPPASSARPPPAPPSPRSAPAGCSSSTRVSYVAVLAGLSAMRRAELHPAKRVERAKGQLREGLAYVRSRPDLLVPIVLVFMVGTFGLNFQITLALVVKEVFERSAGAYGLLSAFLAARLAGRRARQRPPLRAAAAADAVRVGARLRPARDGRRRSRRRTSSWRCCSSPPASRC